MDAEQWGAFQKHQATVELGLKHMNEKQDDMCDRLEGVETSVGVLKTDMATVKERGDNTKERVKTISTYIGRFVLTILVACVGWFYNKINKIEETNGKSHAARIETRVHARPQARQEGTDAPPWVSRPRVSVSSPQVGHHPYASASTPMVSGTAVQEGSGR